VLNNWAYNFTYNRAKLPQIFTECARNRYLLIVRKFCNDSFLLFFDLLKKVRAAGNKRIIDSCFSKNFKDYGRIPVRNTNDFF